MSKDRNSLKAGITSMISRDGASTRLVNGLGRPPKDSPSAWDEKRNYRTSIVMDAKQHGDIRRLSSRCGVTFKDAMFLLLEEGLRRVESGELVIGNGE